jgi:hypothetical protein
MTALYIGNVSQQIQQFLYRPLDGSRPITIEVPIYEQRRIGGELSVPEVNCIIVQHTPYGLRRADEAHLLGPYDSLLFSLGRPITSEQLQIGASRKTMKLAEIGKAARVDAAIKTNAHMQKEVRQKNREFEMSFTEETPAGGFSDSRKPVSEGVVILGGGPPMDM